MAANRAVWVRCAWDGGLGRTPDDVMVGIDGDKVVLHRLHNPSERLVFDKADWAKLVRVANVELALAKAGGKQG